MGLSWLLRSRVSLPSLHLCLAICALSANSKASFFRLEISSTECDTVAPESFTASLNVGSVSELCFSPNGTFGTFRRRKIVLAESSKSSIWELSELWELFKVPIVPKVPFWNFWRKWNVGIKFWPESAQFPPVTAIKEGLSVRHRKTLLSTLYHTHIYLTHTSRISLSRRICVPISQNPIERSSRQFLPQLSYLPDGVLFAAIRCERLLLVISITFKPVWYSPFQDSIESPDCCRIWV